MLALVVGGDGQVHVREGGVGVAEADGGDVHVGGLLDGLVVRPVVVLCVEKGVDELWLRGCSLCKHASSHDTQPMWVAGSNDG